MTRNLLMVLMIISTAISSYAQIPLNTKQYNDSLNNVTINGESVTDKAKANFLLSEFYLYVDSTIANQYLNAGKTISKNDPYLNALYLYYKGLNIPYDTLDTKEILFLKADSLLKSFKTNEALTYRSKCWVLYAIAEKRKDNHKKYVDIILNIAIPLAKQAYDSSSIGRYYTLLGIGFKNILDYASAESYLLQSISILKKNNSHPEYLTSAYHTLAEDYSLSGNPEKAGPLLDSMKVLLLPYPETQQWLDYYPGYTMYLTVSYRFKEALQNVNKGIELAKKMNQSYPEQRLLLQKFYVLFNSSKFSEAKNVMLDLMQRQEIISLATNRTQMYYGLALTYDSLNDMRNAYLWMSRYAALNDSVNKSTTEKEMNALKIKYESGEKEKMISKLESRKNEAELKAKNSRLTNWLLITISAILLIVLGLLYAFFNNNRKLAHQKEINYRQQLKELEQKQQLTTTEAILEGEERERRRMARDLHDGLGGMLAGIKIKLSGQAKKGFYEEDSIKPIISQLDNSVSELRRIARNMMPESLMRFGLETALKDLCESLMSDDVNVRFECYDMEENIDQSKQVYIYRIIQEGLNNAIRHSRAKNILLQCSQNKEILFITIEDDGIGFDRANQQNENGIGMNNIEGRVKYLKGKLDINTAPNEGTTINIELNVTA